MNLYILKEKEFEGLGFGYVLISEQGEGMASCFCKNESRASVRRTMLKQCPVIVQKGWQEKFGEFKILFLGDDEMTREQLVSKNKKLYGVHNVPTTKKEDGRSNNSNERDFSSIGSYMNIMGCKGE